MVTSLSDYSWEKSFQGLMGLKSIWMTQDNCPSQVLNLVVSAKSLCQEKEHIYRQAPLTRMWASFGGTRLLPSTLRIKLCNIECGPIFCIVFHLAKALDELRPPQELPWQLV